MQEIFNSSESPPSASLTTSFTSKVVSSQSDLECSASSTASDSLTVSGSADSRLTAWLAVVSCFLFNLNALGIPYAYGVYQAHYQLYEFAAKPPETISLVGTVAITLSITTGMLTGPLMSRYGVRVVIVGGSLLLSSGLLAAGFCTTLPTLIATQGMMCGLGAGIIYVPANTVPAQYFVKRRTLAMGIASAGAGIGGIMWAFFARIAIARFGSSWALWLSAILSTALSSIATLLLRPRSAPRERPAWTMAAALRLFKDRKFLTLWWSTGIFSFCYMVPFVFVPTYAETQLGVNSELGAILVVIMDLGMAAGRVLLGLLADSSLGVLNTLVIAATLSGICHLTFWLPASKSILPLILFSFSYGFLGGGFIGLAPAILTRIYDPEQLTLLTGVLYTSSLPGELAGGPIAATIYTWKQGDWTFVIMYSASVALLASILAIAARFQVQKRLFAPI